MESAIACTVPGLMNIPSPIILVGIQKGEVDVPWDEIRVPSNCLYVSQLLVNVIDILPIFGGYRLTGFCCWLSSSWQDIPFLQFHISIAIEIKGGHRTTVVQLQWNGNKVRNNRY